MWYYVCEDGDRPREYIKTNEINWRQFQLAGGSRRSEQELREWKIGQNTRDVNGRQASSIRHEWETI